MGSRNIRKAEKKKPRKDNKKSMAPILTSESPPTVEVIKKGKKQAEE